MARLIDIDKWQEIFGSIRRHKLRTFLTALSVWWGIFMLVLLLGAGKGLQNSVEHNFKDDAINSLWIYRGTTSEPYKGLKSGRRIQFDNSDYDLLREQIEGVDKLTGRYYLGGEYFVKHKEKSLSFDVRTVHPDHQFLENTIMIEGRFINDIDIKEYRKVCAIGQLVKEEFFGEDKDAIGEYINVKGIDYKVVGVYFDEGHENEMRKIYLPITTAQKVYEGEGRIHQLMFTMGDANLKETQRIEAAVKNQLATKHKFSPDDEQAIYVSNEFEDYKEFQMVFAFINSFIWFVGIGSIIAGVIGVSNIMLIVVKDRTKEIGVRKAMGATPWSIISMIVQEAIFITSIAGYTGMITGIGLIYGVNTIMVENNIETEFFRNPEVDLYVVLIAFFILIVAGALSGLIPAIQAVRINPVIAMKS
ncbi:MAG: ABC transporter permease [Bacteroidota bacterium]